MNRRYGDMPRARVMPQPFDPEGAERRREANRAEQEATRALLMPISAPASVISAILYPAASDANFVQRVTVPTFLAGVGYGLIAGFALGMFVSRRSS